MYQNSSSPTRRTAGQTTPCLRRRLHIARSNLFLQLLSVSRVLACTVSCIRQISCSTKCLSFCVNPSRCSMCYNVSNFSNWCFINLSRVPASIDCICNFLAVRDISHCPSWCLSVLLNLQTSPPTSTYLICDLRHRLLKPRSCHSLKFCPTQSRLSPLFSSCFESASSHWRSSLVSRVECAAGCSRVSARFAAFISGQSWVISDVLDLFSGAGGSCVLWTHAEGWLAQLVMVRISS